MGPVKHQERSKTYRDAKLCSTSVDNARNQTNSLLSFSSSGSKLNSTLVQYKKQTLHQKSLLRYSNCNILSVERNKLEKSTFEFPSTAKSQTLGKLTSRCILKSTINFLLRGFLPFFQHKSMKTNLNNSVIHFHGCKVKVPKANFMSLSNARSIHRNGSIISNPPQR